MYCCDSKTVGLLLESGFRLSWRELAGWGTFPKIQRPSSRSVQKQTRHFCLGMPVMPQPGTRAVSLSASEESLCTPCDLECTTEFSQRQTTGCVELFLLACDILITRVYVYECRHILPCMNIDICNAECGLQLWSKVDTYLYLHEYLYFH